MYKLLQNLCSLVQSAYWSSIYVENTFNLIQHYHLFNRYLLEQDSQDLFIRDLPVSVVH